MKTKKQKIKTPREVFMDQESEKFRNWCRKNDMEFCSLEMRAAWWAWMGRAEKDLEAYLNSVINYEI